MGIFNLFKKKIHLDEEEAQIDSKDKTSVSDKFNELLKRIYEILKPLGYKKEASNFRLYQPDGLCKIINFQKSQWNTKEHLEFVINVGIYFEKDDIISNLKFKVYECVIENTLGNDNKWWKIDKNTDVDEVFESVKRALDNIFEMFGKFSNKETTIKLILNTTVDKEPDYRARMHYRTAKLLADMGYSNEVYNSIKDSKAHLLIELANQIKNKSIIVGNKTMIDLNEFITEKQSSEQIKKEKMSLIADLEAFIGNYSVACTSITSENNYWDTVYYDSEIDTYTESVERIPKKLVAFVSVDYRWAFVLSRHIEKFKEDTLEYNLTYIEVDSFEDEIMKCSHVELLPKEFGYVTWIDDDFMYDENLTFDYDSFYKIDEGVKYLNPNHFSVMQLVKFPMLHITEQDKRFNQLFQYDEKEQKFMAEINGIKFTCKELKTEYEEFAMNISKLYAEKLPNVIKFIIDDINDMFGKISEEELTKSLGTPLIDLDTETITYLEQTLDDSHIIEVEFSGVLDEFHGVCIDG